MEAQHRDNNESFKLELPNPLQYLNHETTAMSASFRMLTNEQRQMFILECSSFFKSVPCQFYIRIVVGLFVFLELFRFQLNVNKETCLPEVEVWTDTWLNLLASSLLGKFKKSPRQKTIIETQRHDLSVHHILCGLMVSTNSFKMLRSYYCTRRKILTGLEQLTLCSSGFTLTWINTINFYFEF